MPVATTALISAGTKIGIQHTALDFVVGAGTAASQLTVSGTLEDVNGTGKNVIKDGLGTLTFTTSQTYTGTTTVNAGTLALNGGYIDHTSAVNINSGGTISVLGSNQYLFTNPTQTTTISSGGLLTITANNATAHLGPLALAGGTLGSTGTPGGDGLTYGSWNLDKGVTAGGTTATSIISAQSVALTQTGGTIFNVASGATNGIDLDVTGTLQHATGAADTGIIKNGNGVMRLDSINTFTGGLTINSGTVISTTGGSSTSLGTGNVIVNAGGTLQGNAGDAFGYNAGSSPALITIKGGTVTTGANANYRVTLPNLTFDGGGTLSSGSNNSGDGNGNFSPYGQGAATPTITVTNAGATTALISAATVGLPQNGINFVIGTGTAASQLMVTGALVNTNSASRTMTKSGLGTMTLTAANTYTGATNISAGTLQLGNGGTTGTLATGSAIADSGTFAINRSNPVSQGTDFSGAAITGTGGFTQAGSGTTTLTAANTYSGGTTVNSGILQLGNATALGSQTGPLAVNTGGVLDLHGNNQTVGSFSGTGGQISNSVNGNTATLTVGNGGGSGGYAGTIADHNSGTGLVALSKIGSGTETLTGTDTYTGTTTVSAGTLALNTAGTTSAQTTGAVVGSNIIISGDGTVGTIAASATNGVVSLSASNQIGNSTNVTLAGGTLALNGNSEGTTTNSSVTRTGGNQGVTETGPSGAGQLSVTTGSGISYLDFGASNSGAVFTFSSYDFSNTGTLYIVNYNDGNFTGTYSPATGGGIDQLFFGTNGQYSAQELLHVFFVDPIGAGGTAKTGIWEAKLLATGEVVAPEPSEWVSLLVGALGLSGLALKAKKRKANEASAA